MLELCFNKWETNEEPELKELDNNIIKSTVESNGKENKSLMNYIQVRQPSRRSPLHSIGNQIIQRSQSASVIGS